MCVYIYIYIYIYIYTHHTHTFMNLASAFIQSDLHCIQAIHFFCQYVCSLGMNPQPFALLTQCSTTEPQEHMYVYTHTPHTHQSPFKAVVLKLFTPSTTSENICLSKFHHMTNIKMQYKWLPTAPGVCSRCVCVCTLDGLNAEHKFRVCHITFTFSSTIHSKKKKIRVSF